MTARTISDYEPGTELPEIGITVLDLLRNAKAASEVLYRVRHECCGLERDMTRRVMQQRFRDSSKLCAACGRQKAVSRMHDALRDKRTGQFKQEFVPGADYGVSPPMWRPPKSVSLGGVDHWYDRSYQQQ